ncbi:MAG TPA: hypothetical protein VGK81_00800, partial [Anaerolineae bacterium]
MNVVNPMAGGTTWQRNYFERIFGNERELHATREYIEMTRCNGHWTTRTMRHIQPIDVRLGLAANNAQILTGATNLSGGNDARPTVRRDRLR